MVALAAALAVAGAGGWTAAADPSVSVTGAWTRAMPSVATAGEFYMVIENRGGAPDRLVGAESPACAKLEPYESYAGMPGMAGMAGMRGMRPAPGGAIDLPPGRVVLEPGGLHLMCTGKRIDLRAGTRVDVRLRFRDAGEIAVELAVRE
jgi:periplasmic copper chaperone A